MDNVYNSPVDFFDNVGMIASGPAGDTANQIDLDLGDANIQMGMVCSQNTSGKAIRGLDADTCMPLWAVNANEEAVHDIWNAGQYAAGDRQSGIGGRMNFVAGNGGIQI